MFDYVGVSDDAFMDRLTSAVSSHALVPCCCVSWNGLLYCLR